MHSQNVEKSGIKGIASKWGGGPGGRGGARSDERWSWDICGNPSYSAVQKPTDSWDAWAGEPVATYKEGGDIEFTVVVNGEHGGVHDFRLCPKQVSSKLGDMKANAECIDSHFIGRECTPGAGCGCKDDKCKDNTPHKDPNDPIFSHGPAPHNIYGAHVFKFKLPKGVSCDQCTVQWYWATAFGEWFRNCIDIKIEGDGPAPTPPPSGPAPTPPPSGPSPSPYDPYTRRRNEGGRRRRKDGNRRRRRSSRRRRKNGSRRRRRRRRKNSVARNEEVVEAMNAIGQPVVDMEYEEFGCFSLTEGDSASKDLKCDCDFDGKGGRTTDTLRDFTCMEHKEGKPERPCRSGLPFYRLSVQKEAATRLCFSFCSSRGLDLFGLVGETECRCGATLANRKIWKDTASPHESLLLDHDNKLRDCVADSVKVYRYIGWMKYHDSAGVQKSMLDMGKDDQDYIDSVISGHRMKGGALA